MDRVTIENTITLDHLTQQLSGHCYNKALITFVKHLNDYVADWHFTLTLADYFDQERKRFESEDAPC